MPNTGAVTEYQELSTSHAHLSIELHVNKDHNKIEYVFVINLSYKRDYFIYSSDSTRKYLENIEFSSPTTVEDGLSTSTHKSSESTRENLPQNNDLLKNNIVISLLGIFVFFFSVFVMSYIYLKCFRKKSITSVINATDSQAQYKSLNINLVEPENTVQPEPSRRIEMDSAYLLPVFSRNEDSEFEIKLESDKPILDTTIHSYEITNRQELDSMTDNVHDHVYIEITKDHTDNPNTVVDSC